MEKISKILISQPAPADFERSPYAELEKKHNVKFVFQKFFRIEDVTAIEFRKDKVNLLDYTGVLMTSRNAVDHYFRMAKDMRIEIPDSMKFFCLNESIALYLQKYVTYRKRKIFFSKKHVDGLVDIMGGKHKNEKFVIPCADTGASHLNDILDQKNLDYTKAVIFKNVAEELNETINLDEFQLLVLFSPSGLDSLLQNFPDVVDKKIFIATLGANVAQLVKDKNLNLAFQAPTPETPSISAAIDLFLTEHNKA